jgi:hypothetical protein
MGDLFRQVCCAICIPTNGETVNRVVGGRNRCHSKNTMNSGFALKAQKRWPGIELLLGSLVALHGNNVYPLTRRQDDGTIVFRVERMQHFPLSYHILSFPIKLTPTGDIDIMLVERSARQLLNIANMNKWKKIILPQIDIRNPLKKSSIEQSLKLLLDRRFCILGAK